MIKEYYAHHYWMGFIVKLIVLGGAILYMFTDTNSIYFFLIVIGLIIFFNLVDRYTSNNYGTPKNKGLAPYRQRTSALRQILNFFHPKRAYFVCGIDETELFLPELKIPFSKIREIYPEKGGSEAYLLLTDDTRVEMNFSWLSQADKKQVMFLVKNQLNEHA